MVYLVLCVRKSKAHVILSVSTVGNNRAGLASRKHCYQIGGHTFFCANPISSYAAYMEGVSKMRAKRWSVPTFFQLSTIYLF